MTRTTSLETILTPTPMSISRLSLTHTRFSRSMENENTETAMSFTDTDDSVVGTLELEDVMNQQDYPRKRRRSPTDGQDGSLPPLVIQDLSLSPSNRIRRPQTIGLATRDHLTSDSDRNDEIEVSLTWLLPR